MFTLLGFLLFFYGLYELVMFDFWAKPKLRRKLRLRRRPHKTWITRMYDRWWPQSLRFYSFRPRKQNFAAQFAERDRQRREERTKWGR